MEVKFTFNYEVIRDFAGNMIDVVVNNINSGNQYHDVELWKILYVHAFPNALLKYCRTYTYCRRNTRICNIENFRDRYNIMKEVVIESFDEDLRNKMMESLIGERKIDFELIDEVFTTLACNFDIANIITHMLYGYKYLAFRGFAELQNTEFARNLMLKYFEFHTSEWDGDLEEKNIFWGDLDVK